MTLRRWVFGSTLALGLVTLGTVGIVLPAKDLPSIDTEKLAAEIKTDAYTSHEVCAACHVEIHESWSESAHARSVTDPGFRAALEEAVRDHGESTKTLCLKCHAPTTLITGSTDLEDPLVQEGITCDFCHTVKSVDLSRADNPFEIVLGVVKYGPFEFAPSPAHETAFSLLHRNKPTLCAACHEYVNAKGFPVFLTYTEWREGPYPDQGVSCQDCHMALVQGPTARDDLASRDSWSARFINLHRLVGGGSLGQLRRGVDLKVLVAEVRGTEGFVEVEVVNSAAGHKVPTGLPSKQLILTVRALADGGKGKEVFSKTKVYERRVVDGEGNLVKTDAGFFLDAVKQISDNRIAPKKSKRETFRFSLRPELHQVEITLAYRYTPPHHREPQILTIAQEVRDLRRR